jgi:hypothetical protein
MGKLWSDPEERPANDKPILAEALRQRGRPKAPSSTRIFRHLIRKRFKTELRLALVRKGDLLFFTGQIGPKALWQQGGVG